MSRPRKSLIHGGALLRCVQLKDTRCLFCDPREPHGPRACGDSPCSISKPTFFEYRRLRVGRYSKSADLNHALFSGGERSDGLCSGAIERQYLEESVVTMVEIDMLDLWQNTTKDHQKSRSAAFAIRNHHAKSHRYSNDPFTEIASIHQSSAKTRYQCTSIQRLESDLSLRSEAGMKYFPGMGSKRSARMQ